MCNKAFLCPIIFLIPFSSLHAHDDDVRFQRLSIEQGLSQSSVFSIAQDRKGFMWFATQDGIDRYDGYTFKHFEHVDNDSTSLSDNYVNAVLVDHDDILWAGTQGGGLDKYVQATGRFVRYEHVPADPTSLSDNDVRCLFEDRAGELWVGTSNGLDKYDRANDRFVRYVHSDLNRASIPAGLVNSLYEDTNGKILVGMLGALVVLDPSTGKFESLRLPVPGILCVWMAPDSEGNIWIAMQNDLYMYRAGVWTRASRTFGLKKSIVVRRIIRGRSGEMWFGGDDGLENYSERKHQLSTFRNDPGDPQSLSGNSILSLYQDREGILWVGTYDGVDKYSPAEFKFRLVRWNATELESVGWNKIRSFAEDRSGMIWVATQNGLMTYNRKTGALMRLPANGWYKSPSDPRLLWSLLFDKRVKPHALWVGTNGDGLIGLRIDLPSHPFVRYVPRPGDPTSLSSPSPETLYETRAGTVWVGTLFEGLDRFDRKTGRFTRYVNDPSNPHSISGNEVWSMAEDNSGHLWIGTAGKGLDRLDVSTGTFTTYRHNQADSTSLSDDMVTAIVNGKAGELWVGTYSGLNEFDSATGTFRHFTVKDGLSNNVIYGIVDDGRGNLWISTNHGLSRFTIATGTFRNYDQEDGLQSNEFNHGAVYRCSDDELLFGGINGFNIFNPDDLPENTNKPNVVFTDFKIFNKSIAGLAGDHLSSPISSAKMVRLSYKDAVISIDYAALEYTDPHKNQYAYMMKGFDKSWVHAGSRREATYTNLDAGKYTFIVKAANSDGVWNESPSALEIIISPPYWETWWFRSIAILLFLSIGPAIYYSRVNALKKKQVEREDFSRRLIESQEGERKRVAAELHDSIGQDLLVIKNRLLLGLQAHHSGKDDIADFEDAVNHVSDSIKHVREISRNLRPIQLDQIGLTAALESVVETAAEASGMGSHVRIENIDGVFSKENEINFFRIVQESLNNILKHSKASAIEVKIVKWERRVDMEIRDNGRGMEAYATGPGSTSGIGLSSMQERARIIGGDLRIESSAGAGTVVRMVVPMDGTGNA